MARAAGMSEHQQLQAVRVANVPDDAFKAAVEAHRHRACLRRRIGGSFRRSNAKEAESRLGRHELSLSQNLTLRGGSVDEKGSEARRCDGIARGVDQCGG